MPLPFYGAILPRIIKGLLFLGCLYYETQAFGSACCARNTAAPTLILGDDAYQINMSIASSRIVATSKFDGSTYFYPSHIKETLQTLRLEGALLLSDRFQTGLSLSSTQHTMQYYRAQASHFGISDIRLSTAYEYLPLWSYSSWKPQGFLFSIITLPTGRSIYETQTPLGVDAIGNGFYSLSLGTIFVKRWTLWDSFFMLEGHYSLPRSFQQNLYVIPGYGGSTTLGGGFSPWRGPLRLGVRIQPKIDQKRKFLLSQPSRSNWTSSCDVGFDMSYLVASQTSLILSYTDQTLLGPAINSNLSRSLGFNILHRWER